MDCFESDSRVLSESEYFLPWHVYRPVNVLCWLNQDNKNSGAQKVATDPDQQLWPIHTFYHVIYVCLMELLKAVNMEIHTDPSN